jgi:DNA-binding response OmpR family regulator
MKSPNRRLLYVEDHADTRELVSLLLERQNFDVVAVENPDEALELARAQVFELYLIDNQLPSYSGIVLCRKIREFDSTTPILFCSAAAYETDKNAALESGAQGYLVKPIDSDELISEVIRLLTKVDR